MKNYVSKIIIGCLGFCAGFALCYFSIVSPVFHKTGSKITAAAERQKILTEFENYRR